ncbi:alpha and gamma adaptin binding protein p34 [Ophiostoma piceae UAMH 11346]|uniref:Alpha and gamma adaptin binding protein p34 n=1 Tax=Ophiostoma piceae (strain UAMH 11346) TaxID=1262450 RepID=S3CGI8_OPHP1|nr:alpha and gamma adaptin binding protein p34 [Ophiostoma piceae UAMH 11346]
MHWTLFNASQGPFVIATTSTSPASPRPSMPSEIQNPRRILAVALTRSQDHLSSVIGKLTGSYPSVPFAGSTHDLALDTPYYRAQVPVWLDLVGEEAEADAEDGEDGERKKDDKKTEKSPYDSDDEYNDDDDDPVQAWADAFLADEASEVREALGGIVAVVDASDYKQQRSLVNHVGRLARGCAPAEKGDDEDDEENNEEEIQGLSSWDGIGLVVGVSTSPLGDDAMLVWDDLCVEAGLEFVLVAPGQADVNEWGEKTGVERVLEALKANDWQGGDAPDPFGEFQDGDDFLSLGADDLADDDNDDNQSSASLDFGYDKSDFEGLRQAIWQQQTKEVEDGAEAKDKKEDTADKEGKEDKEGRDEGDKKGKDDRDDEDIVVEQLIQKLQAARMQGELLPPAQRRALAARVVGEVMKDI